MYLNNLTETETPSPKDEFALRKIKELSVKSAYNFHCFACFTSVLVQCDLNKSETQAQIWLGVCYG